MNISTKLFSHSFLISLAAVTYVSSMELTKDLEKKRKEDEILHALSTGTVPSEKKATVLQLAAKKGYTTVFDQLILGDESFVRATFAGNTLLHIAAEHEQLEIVRMLLDAGADVNALNDQNMRPLHLIAQKALLYTGGDPAVIKQKIAAIKVAHALLWADPIIEPVFMKLIEGDIPLIALVKKHLMRRLLTATENQDEQAVKNYLALGTPINFAILATVSSFPADSTLRMLLEKAYADQPNQLAKKEPLKVEQKDAAHYKQLMNQAKARARITAGDTTSSKTASLFTTEDILQREARVLNWRKQRIAAAFKNFLPEMIFSTDDLPSVGFGFSGGGVRAMFQTIGWLSGAKKIGILDTASYATGLSGSTWALNPWVVSGLDIDAYRKQLGSRLAKSKLEYVKAMDKLKVGLAYARKLCSDQRPGLIIDLYGNFLASLFLPGLDSVKNPYEHTLSALVPRLVTGKFPLVISTAVLGSYEKQERPTFEFSPLASGSFDMGRFVPTWALGRRFYDGKQQEPELRDLHNQEATSLDEFFGRFVDTDTAQSLTKEVISTTTRDKDFYGLEPSLGYIMGICGSALSVGSNDILLELYNSIKPSAGTPEDDQFGDDTIFLVREVLSDWASSAGTKVAKKVPAAGALNSVSSFLQKGGSISQFTDIATVQKWQKQVREWEADPSALKDEIKEKVKFGNFAAAELHNFAHGMPGIPLSSLPTLSLVDGGFQVQNLRRLNLAIMPFLQRKLDLIVLCDSSRQDLSGAPSLQATELLVRTLNDEVLNKIKEENPGRSDSVYQQLLNNDERTIHFPKITPATRDLLGNELATLIEDETDMKAPIIVYMPGIGSKKFDELRGLSEHFDPCIAEFTGTLNFTYTLEQSDQLMSLLEYNVLQSNDIIKKAYVKAVQRKNIK